MLDSPEQLRMISSFPLSRLATMLGDALGDGGDDIVETLLARAGS